jgi:hypothetical protein
MLYSHKDFLGLILLVAQSTPGAIVLLEGSGNMKKIHRSHQDQTHYFTACSIVPQPMIETYNKSSYLNKLANFFDNASKHASYLLDIQNYCGS